MIGETASNSPKKNAQKMYEAILGEKNSKRYLSEFEVFDKQGSGMNRGWNWSALLFGGVWALYRKMYGWFFIMMFVNAVANGIPPVLAVILLLISGGFFAVYADSIYHKNINMKIASAQRKFQDESELLKYLQRRGGVNRWVVWLFGWGLGGLVLLGILVAILLPMLARH